MFLFLPFLLFLLITGSSDAQVTKGNETLSALSECYQSIIPTFDMSKGFSLSTADFLVLSDEKWTKVCSSLLQILGCADESGAYEHFPQLASLDDYLIFSCNEGKTAMQSLRSCFLNNTIFYKDMFQCFKTPTNSTELDCKFFTDEYQCMMRVNNETQCMDANLLEAAFVRFVQPFPDHFAPECQLQNQYTEKILPKDCNLVTLTKCNADLMQGYYLIFIQPENSDFIKDYCENLPKTKKCFEEQNCFEDNAVNLYNFKIYWDVSNYGCQILNDNKTNFQKLTKCLEQEGVNEAFDSCGGEFVILGFLKKSNDELKKHFSGYTNCMEKVNEKFNCYRKDFVLKFLNDLFNPLITKFMLPKE